MIAFYSSRPEPLALFGYASSRAACRLSSELIALLIGPCSGQVSLILARRLWSSIPLSVESLARFVLPLLQVVRSRPLFEVVKALGQLLTNVQSYCFVRAEQHSTECLIIDLRVSPIESAGFAHCL